MEQVKNLEGEVWKDIPQYEGLYKISNMGRVMNKKGYIMKPRIIGKPKNCVEVSLSKDNYQYQFKIHVLVATAFVPNTLGYARVKFKDGNRFNVKADNLYW